jgi:hypothetical protein
MRRPYPIVAGQGEVFREDFRSWRSVAENGGVITSTTLPTIRDGLTTTLANTQWVSYPAKIDPGPTTAMSVAATCKFSDVSGIKTIAARWKTNDAKWIVRQNASRWEFFVAPTLADAGGTYIYTTSGNPTNGVMYQVVFVYNGALAAASRALIYSNGSLCSKVEGLAMPAAMTTSAQPVSILGHASAVQNNIGLALKQLRIFQRALLPDEVLDLYQQDTLTELQP